MFEHNEELVIELNDNGGGIYSEVIQKVFDPYFTTKGPKTGTGLGLYVSKSIVEHHLKGTISVENNAKGALFSIRLPLI